MTKNSTHSSTHAHCTRWPIKAKCEPFQKQLLKPLKATDFYRGIKTETVIDKRMGKITVFTRDGCSACGKVKQLLSERGAAELREISLTTSPEWANLLFLLANGDKSVPQVFFNSRHVGCVEVEQWESEGVLGERVRECLEGGSEGEDFPPPLRTPEPQEYVQLIPAEVRSQWQSSLEAMGASLTQQAGRQISSLVITLETPDSILVVCTAGPAKETFVVGATVKKGPEDSQCKAYCQVALERDTSLFVVDPTAIPGLEQNQLMLTFGYSYYAGAPWTVGHHRGTVVAMEKESGVLQPEHMTVIEATRDEIVAQYQASLSQ